MTKKPVCNGRLSVRGLIGESSAVFIDGGEYGGERAPEKMSCQ